MFLSQKNRAVIAISIGIICYFITGYFLDRTNYFQLTVQYLILCIVFWYVITTEKNNFTLLLALSILFRLIFLFAIHKRFLEKEQIHSKKSFFKCNY